MSALRIPSAIRLLIGLLLLAGPAAPAGAVLCVASEGHSAIESVASARCHSSNTHADIPDDGCPRECKDTPLGDGPAIRAASHPVVATVHSIVPPGRPRPPTVSLGLDFVPAWVPFAPPSTAVHHSTILRC